MFKRAAKSIVKELDPEGELHPLTSAYESNTLDLYSVVKIVESSRFFYKKKIFRPTSVKLQELLCGDNVDFGEQSRKDIGAMAMKERINCSMDFDCRVMALVWGGQANLSMDQTSSASESKLERVMVNLSALQLSLQNVKVNTNHPLIQNLSSSMRLGVVYDILKTKNPLTLIENLVGRGEVGFSICDTNLVDSAVKANREKRLQLEAGCVLGFKVLRLDGAVMKSVMEDDGVPETMSGCLDDFHKLKQKVQELFSDFSIMAQDVRKLIWDPLSEILKCPETLYVLDCILEEGCVNAASPFPLENMPRKLQQKLQDLLKVVGLEPDISDVNVLFSPLSQLVNSLTEIGKEAVSLIVGLNGEVRGKVQEQVESTLEYVCSGETSVPQGSRQFSESTKNVTKETLSACGLTMDEDNLYPGLGAPKAPHMILVCLYIALYGLNILLEP